MESPVARLRAKWEDIKVNSAQQHRGEAGVEAVVAFMEEITFMAEITTTQLTEPVQVEQIGPTKPTVVNEATDDKEVKDGSQEHSQGS